MKVTYIRDRQVNQRLRQEVVSSPTSFGYHGRCSTRPPPSAS